jgi:class 3 adenylate cyclase
MSVVDVLNGVFSAFDAIVGEYRLEKIKTIGDAYVVVGGLDDEAGDHLVRMASLGLAMVDVVDTLAAGWGPDVRVRVGIHTGPAVAGVIGIKKFIYDVWGDTVNTASRLEGAGVPGRVQVSDASRERLRDRFAFESRGPIELKGKGWHDTFLLVGPPADRDPGSAP